MTDVMTDELVRLQEVVAIIGRCCPACRALAMQRLAALQPVQATHVARAVLLRGMLLDLCEIHKVSLADVYGPSRDSELIEVRREFAVAARDRGCSLPHIGRMLRRHHTTVLNYLKPRPSQAAAPAPSASPSAAAPH